MEEQLLTDPDKYDLHLSCMGFSLFPWFFWEQVSLANMMQKFICSTFKKRRHEIKEENL